MHRVFFGIFSLEDVISFCRSFISSRVRVFEFLTFLCMQLSTVLVLLLLYVCVCVSFMCTLAFSILAGKLQCPQCVPLKRAFTAASSSSSLSFPPHQQLQKWQVNLFTDPLFCCWYTEMLLFRHIRSHFCFIVLGAIVVGNNWNAKGKREKKSTKIGKISIVTWYWVVLSPIGYLFGVPFFIFVSKMRNTFNWLAIYFACDANLLPCFNRLWHVLSISFQISKENNTRTCASWNFLHDLHVLNHRRTESASS